MFKIKFHTIIAIFLILLIIGSYGSGEPAEPTISFITAPQEATSAATTTADALMPPTETSASLTIPATTHTETTTAGISLPEDSTFQVHFLDAGQADAALVGCDGHWMLIDGGNPEDSSLIYAYLKSHGIAHLDYIIGTHGHSDHIGGLPGALNYATVGTAYCSVTKYDSRAFDSFIKYLDKQDKTITVPSPGDTFHLGSATAIILGPIHPNEKEPNNTSLVIRICYGDTSFLFTGDAEDAEEKDILDAGYDLRSTVLKVGHHGSSSSTSYRWLREIMPEYAVISAGKDNDYGHPHEAVLSRLRDADVTVFRTDMQGHIICTSDGQTVTFTVERNENTDTLSGAGLGGNHSSEASPTQPQGVINNDAGSAYTYVCNKNTKKFHFPSCKSVSQMSEKNKLEITATRQELIDKGYEPCGNCKP